MVAAHLGGMSVGNEGADFIAVFWMESVEKKTIWCELHNYELGNPIGLTLYIRNPEKENK